MSNEVANTTGGALGPVEKRRGFEEPAEQSDLEIPRAKLLQALSPEVVDPQSTLKAGQVINSLTRAPLGGEFIPIFRMPSSVIKFNPRKKDDPNFDPNFGPGDLIWRTEDPDDPRWAESAFGANGELPKATKFLNFFAWFPGSVTEDGRPLPCVLSFSKTSFAAGKHLNSLLQLSSGDMFAAKYRLSTKQKQNDAGTFFILVVDPAGKTSDQEFAFAESLYEAFHANRKKMRVEMEAEDPADVSAGHEGSSGKPLF